MNLIDRDKIPNYQIYGAAKIGDIEQPAEMRIAFWSDIEKMPVVSPENFVVHGQWLDAPYVYYGAKRYVCNQCADDEYWRKRFHTVKERFCPNCGAKMDSPEQSGV